MVSTNNKSRDETKQETSERRNILEIDKKKKDENMRGKKEPYKFNESKINRYLYYILTVC